jgi:plastocyanin
MHHSTARRLWLAGSLSVAAMMLACGGGDKKEEPKAEERREASGEVKPAPGGRVLAVSLYSNEKGNYFEPSEITARQGDVVKFELKVGVHNVNFLADSNPGKTGLPKPSDFLQLPGQTFDLLVYFEPGKYYFQCDPHAALGMKGHLTVNK